MSARIPDQPITNDHAEDTCWCGRELDQRDECPVHGEPKEAAEQESAERRMDRMREGEI